MASSLDPKLLKAGATTRLSEYSKRAHLNAVRQAEIGRALLEDRALRRSAPLPPSLVEGQVRKAAGSVLHSDVSL